MCRDLNDRLTVEVRLFSAASLLFTEATLTEVPETEEERLPPVE